MTSTRMTPESLLDPMTAIDLKTTSSSFSDHLEEKKSTEDVKYVPYKAEAKQASISPQPSVWRDRISSERGAKFPPASGRYHLFASYACPSSHRTLIVRQLKGLEDAVPVTMVRPGDKLGRNWMVVQNKDAGTKPAFETVQQVYQHCHAQQANTTTNTIPLLWDNKRKTIVNNNATDIAQMFNDKQSFHKFANKPNTLDLEQTKNAGIRAKLREIQEWLSPMLTPADHQPPHYYVTRAEWELALGRADDILQRQRYLTSHTTVTQADLDLFVTLVRYNETAFSDPALLDFCRDIYQMPGVAKTCQLDERGLSLLCQPHKRHKL